MWNHFLYMWTFHLMCEVLFSYTKISHVKFWSSSFHMWIGYFTCEQVPILICEMKISFRKTFQFHMFIACEMICEIFVRVNKPCNFVLLHLRPLIIFLPIQVAQYLNRGAVATIPKTWVRVTLETALSLLIFRVRCKFPQLGEIF